MSKAEFSEEINRNWLVCKVNGREIKYAYPPVQGTHVDNYKKINEDSEIVPAEGLDISLLTKGAFSRNSPQWKDVRDRTLIGGYTRIPSRLLWVPSNHKLEGVFVQKDTQGKGLSERMSIPESVDGWKQQGNLYLKDDFTFVPKGVYRLGEHNQKTFSKDGLAIALLTEEGAEIFARTAYDNKRVPYNWGVDIDSLSSPEQRVAYVFAFMDTLYLNGYNQGDDSYGFSFGVR